MFKCFILQIAPKYKKYVIYDKIQFNISLNIKLLSMNFPILISFSLFTCNKKICGKNIFKIYYATKYITIKNNIVFMTFLFISTFPPPLIK